MANTLAVSRITERTAWLLVSHSLCHGACTAKSSFSVWLEAAVHLSSMDTQPGDIWPVPARVFAGRRTFLCSGRQQLTQLCYFRETPECSEPWLCQAAVELRSCSAGDLQFRSHQVTVSLSPLASFFALRRRMATLSPPSSPLFCQENQLPDHISCCDLGWATKSLFLLVLKAEVPALLILRECLSQATCRQQQSSACFSTGPPFPNRPG